MLLNSNLLSFAAFAAVALVDFATCLPLQLQDDDDAAVVVVVVVVAAVVAVPTMHDVIVVVQASVVVTCDSVLEADAFACVERFEGNALASCPCLVVLGLGIHSY